MSALTASAQPPLPPTFQVLNGRSPLTSAPDEGVSLWVCLRGTIEVDSLEGPFPLTRGQYLTLPPDARASFAPGAPGLGLLLVIPPALLTARGRGHAGPQRSPPIFAFRSRAPRELLQQSIATLRHGAHWDDNARMFRALQLMRLALSAQEEIRTWLARVPGRSETHRRNTLQRLLRARNAILNMPFESHDLDSLAYAANYSKSHFLRTFRDVFGETPGALLTVSRIAMAKSLMYDSALGIGEIAADVGYGSRCAFSRMFKSHVGVSASSFRRLLDTSLHAPANEPDAWVPAHLHP